MVRQQNLWMVASARGAERRGHAAAQRPDLGAGVLRQARSPRRSSLGTALTSSPRSGMRAQFVLVVARSFQLEGGVRDGHGEVPGNALLKLVEDLR